MNVGGNGVNSNAPVYLQFVTGGATSGVYTNTGIIDTAHFTATTTDTNTRSGNCILPKVNAGGYTQTTTNIVISTTGAHELLVGDSVYIVFRSGTATTGTYVVTAVSNPTHFTVTTTTSKSQNQNVLTVYPLAPPPLNRSGTVVMQEDTWNMGYTDTSTPSLSQSPLRSPTVFNYFYPGYQFPGTLASAGLTTPEFQLTTDSGVAGQMNFIEGGLLNNTGNTNGYSSFFNGNGSIVINLRPWMTLAYTSNTGVPSLVDGISSLLAAGQLSPNARSAIINYVASTNFPYTTPTYTQMRDRVRAVVHLVVSSPDYIIQK